MEFGLGMGFKQILRPSVHMIFYLSLSVILPLTSNSVTGGFWPKPAASDQDIILPTGKMHALSQGEAVGPYA